MIEQIEVKKVGPNRAVVKAKLCNLDKCFIDVDDFLNNLKNNGFKIIQKQDSSITITANLWYKEALQVVEDIIVDHLFPETRDCSRYYSCE